MPQIPLEVVLRILFEVFKDLLKNGDQLGVVLLLWLGMLSIPYTNKLHAQLECACEGLNTLTHGTAVPKDSTRVLWHLFNIFVLLFMIDYLGVPLKRAHYSMIERAWRTIINVFERALIHDDPGERLIAENIIDIVCTVFYVTTFREVKLMITLGKFPIISPLLLHTMSEKAEKNNVKIQQTVRLIPNNMRWFVSRDMCSIGMHKIGKRHLSFLCGHMWSIPFDIYTVDFMWYVMESEEMYIRTFIKENVAVMRKLWETDRKMFYDTLLYHYAQEDGCKELHDLAHLKFEGTGDIFYAMLIVCTNKDEYQKTVYTALVELVSDFGDSDSFMCAFHDVWSMIEDFNQSLMCIDEIPDVFKPIRTGSSSFREFFLAKPREARRKFLSGLAHAYLHREDNATFASLFPAVNPQGVVQTLCP